MTEKKTLRASLNDAVKGAVLRNERSASVNLTPYLTRSLDADVEQKFVFPFEENLVLAKAGATILTGLKKDISFIETTGVAARWATEEPDDPTLEVGEEKFSPKRLVSVVEVSDQLLYLSNDKFDKYLTQLVARSITQKLEKTIFGNHAASEGIPAGIFNGAESLGELSWDNIVAMETSIDTAGALSGSLSYVTHPTLYGAAKLAIKEPSGAGIGVNGYDVYRTANVPSNLGTGKNEHGIAFGDWSNFFIGQWGDIQAVIDLKTFAIDGIARIIINSFFDYGAIQPEAIKVATLTI